MAKVNCVNEDRILDLVYRVLLVTSSEFYLRRFWSHGAILEKLSNQRRSATTEKQRRQREPERKVSDTVLWRRQWRCDGITFTFHTRLSHIYYSYLSFPCQRLDPIILKDLDHETRKFLTSLSEPLLPHHTGYYSITLFTWGYCHLHVPCQELSMYIIKTIIFI